ncbi:histidine kinase [Streptomyces sp. NPDC046203]|uniref:sensor histidine kinase n=1 Tax=Streptomyces sp. NPDC046203 TaxID=3154602 RepID=UPI0033CB9CE0
MGLVDLVAALTRDLRDAPHPVRRDAAIAAGLALMSALSAQLVVDGRRPDALGWALLLGLHVPLVWRRRHPMPALLAQIPLVAPYHALDYMHVAPIPASLVLLYTVAVTGSPRRTATVGAAVTGIELVIQLAVSPHDYADILRVSGWVIAIMVFGTSIRLHRQLAASAVEKAEREAERLAEQRVADERLRIARDLHDLLAHSITLVGVQTSVAAHLLVADPGRLDRAALARALDGIADTCREARAEVRATLDVLRADGPALQQGPLPGLAGLPDLVRAARGELTVRIGDVRVPAAVGATAYRIVQESLTNAVRHAGSGAAVRVDIGVAGEVGGTGGARTLTVRVRDEGAVDGLVDGPALQERVTSSPGSSDSGYGILGMRERARSVGGTLDAGPRADGAGGFEVRAALPLDMREAPSEPASETGEATA